MLDIDSFAPFQLQAAAFTPRVASFPAGIVKELLVGLPEFAGDPIVLPVPADAPGEIPRLILQDASGGQRLQVAGARTDVFLVREPGEPGVESAAFFEAAARTLETVLQKLGHRPGRLAAVGVYFLEIDRPSSELVAHFCRAEWYGRDRPLADLDGFELHAHTKSELMEGLRVNSWTRFKTGSVTRGGSARTAVVAECDINTLAEEADAKSFTADEVAGFMDRAGERLIANLRRFAGGGS